MFVFVKQKEANEMRISDWSSYVCSSDVGGTVVSKTGKPHVAVLMGGWASEREVSLMSGKGVADALESRGYRVTRIDMDRQVAARIAAAAPDVVFNALHGVPGEDGKVQGMLDLMGVPYTH